jgi:hypothetical protein
MCRQHLTSRILKISKFRGIKSYKFIKKLNGAYDSAGIAAASYFVGNIKLSQKISKS